MACTALNEPCQGTKATQHHGPIDINVNNDFGSLAQLVGAGPVRRTLHVMVCREASHDVFTDGLENDAEAMINSRPLGAMVPMSDEAITELTRAFLNEA